MANMLVNIPYNLEAAELKPEPGCDGLITRHLEWLAMNADRDDGEEAERIMRGAICLYHHQEKAIPFAECLETAIVWERG